jgi:DNA-binding response OmpR family regulator
VNARILIVDDDPVYRKLLAMGLEFAEFEVSTAKNGADAKNVLERVTPDVIVVDMLMPVLDGLGFIHWLKGEAGMETPVILLSSLDSRTFAVEALVAGAADVVLKPVGLDEIVDKIRALVPAEETSRTDVAEPPAESSQEDVEPEAVLEP